MTIHVTRNATITFYKAPTVDEVIDQLAKLPEDMRSGRVHVKQTDSQRDGTTITFTIDAGSTTR